MRWQTPRCTAACTRDGPNGLVVRPGSPAGHEAGAELCALPIPPDWPQFGIELTAGWARRGWQGAIAHTRLLEESPGRCP